MASRRDQYQAWRFLSRRHAAALLDPDVDAAETPLRRMAGATAASAVVGLLVVAVVGLYGLFRPGSDTSWRDGKSIILEPETGTRYVFVGGTLHPVLNYASAKLLTHGGTIVSVHQSALADTPHGSAVGILDAPDAVPTGNALLGPQWTACSAPAKDAAGASRAWVRLSAGTVSGSAVPSGTAALVRAGDNELFLVLDGVRLRLAAGTVGLTALGYAASVPLLVGDAWLDVVPQGADLAALLVAGVGTPLAGGLAGQAARVGQLFQTPDGTTYLVEPDGLLPLTRLRAALQLADPATGAAYPGQGVQPLPLSTAAAAQARRSGVILPTGLPQVPPVLVDTSAPGTGLCLSISDTSGQPVLTAVSGTVAQASTGVHVDRSGSAVADAVEIPSGRGALVRAVPGADASVGTIYLVTDRGLAYPVAGAAELTDLGLGSTTPTPVPAAFVRIIPAGPTLAEATAGTPVGAV
jgi:type VII secretion protein EccB